MSTILDALKKLERERRRQAEKSPRREILNSTQLPAGGRRLRLPVLLATGVAGVAAGAALALWRSPLPQSRQVPPSSEQPAETATVPPASELREPALSRPAALAVDQPAQQADTSSSARSKLSPLSSQQAPSEPAQASTSAQATRPLAVKPAAGPAMPGGSAAEMSAVEHPKAGKRSAASRGAEQSGKQEMGPEKQEEGEEIETAEEGKEQAIKVIDTGRSPAGVPKIVLGMLQWSPRPERRFAFISVDGSPFQKLREGERARGLAITRIDKDAVVFQYESTRFVIRPRH